VDIVVRVEPATTALPAVDYRWDADTDILTAALHPRAVGEGMSGSVEIEGKDGSWLILEASGGRIVSVEVAVWPEVRKVASLAAPAHPVPSLVVLPSRQSESGVAVIEVDTMLAATADKAERTIHFRIGPARPTRPVGLAQDIVLDIDERERIAGVWLLNVPPFPAA
jgi:hypothetical protein